MAQEAISLIRDAEAKAGECIENAELQAKNMSAQARSKSERLMEQAKLDAYAEAERIKEKAKQEYDEYIETYLKEHENNLTALQSKAEQSMDMAIRELTGLLF